MQECFSGLKIVLPDQKPIEVDPKYLEFRKTILLVLTMIVYGATILKSWLLFIDLTFFGLFILFFGRKKMEVHNNFSFPFVAIFMYLYTEYWLFILEIHY